MKKFYLLILLLIGLSLSACSTLPPQRDGAPRGYVNFNAIPDAVPKVLPKSHYGNARSYRVMGKTYYVRNSAVGYDERGIASWYGTKFYGQLTSTRSRYNLYAMTAAMPTLPIPSFVQVTNLENGKKVIVEVNDRGPFKKNRIIDLSYAAAGKLGIYPKGTGLVEVRAIDPRTWNRQENTNVYATYASRTPIQKSGNLRLYLQVGAFSEASSAEKMLSQLHQRVNEPSRIESANPAGRKIYRVQVGPLPSVAVSDMIYKRLQNLGYGTPMTVIK